MRVLASLLVFVAVLARVRSRVAWYVARGDEAWPHEFPSIVSLQAFRRGRWQHFCGGVLIGPRKVATAAHCNKKKFSIRVVLGAHRLSTAEHDGAVIVRVVDRHVHPKYSRPRLRYDSMVLLLERAVPETAAIRYARLPPVQGRTPPIYMDCDIAGWGVKTSTDRASDVLMKGKMDIWPDIDEEDMSRDKLYAEPAGNRLTSTCRGDSGGPLYCPAVDGGQPFLTGTVSGGEFHMRCGPDDSDKIFARVDEIVDWMRLTFDFVLLSV